MFGFKKISVQKHVAAFFKSPIPWVIALCLSGWASQAHQKIASEFHQILNQHASRITYVISAPLKIHGFESNVMASGTDVCPKQEHDAMRALFGDSTDAGEHTCFVVSSETERLSARVYVQNSPVKTEEWVVVRDDGRVSFRRLDGSPVLASFLR